MTASWSGTGELSELLVGDEAALGRSQFLHAYEELALLVVVEIEPELVRLDSNRIDPALLAEHDAPLGGDKVRRVRLDRGRIVELTRDRTRLARKEILSDERLVRLERVAGELAQPLGELAHPVEPELRVHAVQPAQSECDLGEVGVACTLP